MVAAVEGIFAEVIQSVVHPAHVPLEIESKATILARSCHFRPCGSFFRKSQDVRKLLVYQGVESFKKLYGLNVLAPAEFIGQPLAGSTGIVQVQHGRDGVHAQAVNVILVEPKQCVGEQKGADLGALEVECERAPVLLVAPAWVG